MWEVILTVSHNTKYSISKHLDNSISPNQLVEKIRLLRLQQIGKRGLIFDSILKLLINFFIQTVGWTRNLLSENLNKIN